MFPDSAARIEAELPSDAVVLDIGAWGSTFPRADWVLDRNPYETRGLYGEKSETPERFTANTWVVWDICDRRPFPFEDKQFDFVICSHTLEDIRDPIWVCSEINRIGKAGYIEVPSRLEEQSYGVQGPWVGWGHHHWLIDIEPGHRIEFTFKHHIINRAGSHFPAGFHERLAPEEKVQTLWWTSSFEYAERSFDGPADADRYFESFVEEHAAARGVPERPSAGIARRAANKLLGR